MRVTLGIFLCTMLGIGVTSPAQEFVQLSDGTAVEAKVKQRSGRAVLKSAFGEREVSAQDVAGTVAAKEVRQSYDNQVRDLPKANLAAKAAVAHWCANKGLLSGAKEQLQQILQADIDQASAVELAQKLAKNWRMHELEASTRKADLDELVEALFDEVGSKGPLEAVMALEKLRSIGGDIVFRGALKNLRHQAPFVRWMSARALADYRNEPERIKPLFKRSLVDEAYAVRREAVRSLKVTGDPVFVKLYAKNLANRTDAIRVHSGEALGELGMKEGVAPLVAALADSWKPTRNFVSSTTQTAYVKDFDVEIAQAAVIADPIVDVVQEGAVLDVGVISVNIERGTYARALSTLTGQDLGTDVEPWRKFLAR